MTVSGTRGGEGSIGGRCGGRLDFDPRVPEGVFAILVYVCNIFMSSGTEDGWGGVGDVVR